jgi:hypothetical protein
MNYFIGVYDGINHVGFITSFSPEGIVLTLTDFYEDGGYIEIAEGDAEASGGEDPEPEGVIDYLYHQQGHQHEEQY